MPLFRVVVLGGYGQFGSRISSQLALDATLHVVIAGRSTESAHRLVKRLRGQGAAARLTEAALDTESADFDEALARLAPDLVIHTAGPFQGSDYRVASAAQATGAHYVDLADARAFVSDIDSLDQQARERRRWVIAGASSVPGLSTAVVEAHIGEFSRLERVETAISPGNQTDRGLATTRAILGYVGKPWRILADGRWRKVSGWQSLRRMDTDEGARRWLARCEVPDLTLLPARYPQLRHCDFRAGLELRRMHFGLWLCSWLVRAGVLRRLTRLAPVLLAISQRWMKAGSDIGYMRMTLGGIGIDGQPLTLHWTLRAQAGDGPQVPATAAVVLAHKLATASLDTQGGARPCMDLFTLDEFLAALEGYAITTGVERIRGAGR